MKIALAGIGGYGAVYAWALLAASPEKEVVFTAGIDPQPERSPAYQAIQEAGISIYPDLDAFYAQQQADLVVVATPIHLHAPLTLSALSHGSAVLCEKPLAARLAEGRVMQAAERQTGLPVGIGYQWSFSAAVQALKQDIQAGLLGRPLRLKTLVLWPRSQAYYRRSPWAGMVQMPDGAWVLDSPVNNATAHYLHNMLYLLGDQRETAARITRLEAEVYRANAIPNFDTAAMRLWTDTEVELLFYTAHPVLQEVGPQMVYEFEHATVFYNAHAEEEFIANFRDGTSKNYGSPNEDPAEKLWQMVAALHGGPPPACGIQAALVHTSSVEALRAVEILTFPEGMLREETTEQDRLLWVEGLAEAFQEDYANNKLPGEVGGAAWAVKPQWVQVVT
jgi:predicted dehydrogenase